MIREMRKPLFWETFFLLAVVSFVNYIATAYHLYWSINEFDSGVHFLGGATVSTFFAWLYFYSGYFSPARRDLWQFFLISVIGTLFISVSWEAYELVLGEARFDKAGYAFDTALDLIMDTLGSIAACFYAYMREVKISTEIQN